MTEQRNIHRQVSQWVHSKSSEKRIIIALSFFVGLFASLAANILHTTIDVLHHLVTMHISSVSSFMYILSPMIGILLTVLFVHYLVKDDISHGVTKILYAISQRKSIIKSHNMWSSVVGSALTIGFGGSVGAESPIVLTGAAIGSNMAKFFRLSQKTLMLMVGCGAAGAIGGIFKAPMAGVVFVLEVLLMDLTMTSLSPLLISSITATALSYILQGSTPMFPLSIYEPFLVGRIPFYLILGVTCGLVSLYFTRGMSRLERYMRKIPYSWLKIVIGGSVLSLLIFLFPCMYGEGYETITVLLNGHSDTFLTNTPLATLLTGTWGIIIYITLVVFFKIFASVATNGAGGVGGIFAPTLFIGALTGFAVATVFAMIGIQLPITNYTLVGMAGLMAGVMHAPLTGIFLIAELTSGYHLFMPLMIVSVISYLTIRLFEPHSLYAIRLAQKGELLTHNKDRSVLTLMKMDNVLETDFTKIYPTMTLGDLVKEIASSKRNLFPVVNSTDGTLQGILLLDEVRNIMFQPRLYNRFHVSDLMTYPPAVLTQEMPMEKVMETFEDTGAWNLPVVDTTKQYIGFVSKSKIFNTYRQVLVRFSEE